MTTWQLLLFVLLGMIEGGGLVALGMWSERRSTLREQEALLKWMEAQEQINRELFSHTHDIAADLARQQRTSTGIRVL